MRNDVDPQSNNNSTTEPNQNADPEWAEFQAWKASRNAGPVKTDNLQSVNEPVVNPNDPGASNVTVAKENDALAERDLETEFTHWVHLANGEVKKTFGGVTRWHETDNPNDPGVPVIGVYAR